MCLIPAEVQDVSVQGIQQKLKLEISRKMIFVENGVSDLKCMHVSFKVVQQLEQLVSVSSACEEKNE